MPVAKHVAREKPAEIVALPETRLAKRVKAALVMGNAYPLNIYAAACLHIVEPVGFSSVALSMD